MSEFSKSPKKKINLVTGSGMSGKSVKLFSDIGNDQGGLSGLDGASLQQLAESNGVSIGDLEKILNRTNTPSGEESRIINYGDNSFTLENIKKVVEECGDPNLIKIKLSEGSVTTYTILEGFSHIANNYGFSNESQLTYINIIKYAIKWGLDVNKKDKQLSTILHTTCLKVSEGCKILFNILIDAGVDVNAPNQYGTKPLQNAASRNNFYAITKLISNGADTTSCEKTRERASLQSYIEHDVRVGKAVEDGFKERDEIAQVALNTSYTKMIKTDPAGFLDKFDILVTI
jgi:hypothetical protein